VSAAASGARDPDGVVPASSPVAAVAGGASSEVAAAGSTPDRVAAPAARLMSVAVEESSLPAHGGSAHTLAAEDASAPSAGEPLGGALVRSAGEFGAGPVERRAFDASRQRPAPAVDVAAVAPAPAVPVGAGGGSAAATGAAAGGLAVWLSLAVVASMAVFFFRLISLPAVPRPVPFISLLERPG